MSSDLDNLLKEIDCVSPAVPQAQSEKKDITSINFSGVDISVDDDSAIMAAIINSSLEDKKRADELYRFYERRIEMDHDHSDSVREGMSKAIELRQGSTSNLIKIFELKKKYSNAQQGNSLVNVTLTQRDTGINIKNLASEILNE